MLVCTNLLFFDVHNISFTYILEVRVCIVGHSLSNATPGLSCSCGLNVTNEFGFGPIAY